MCGQTISCTIYIRMFRLNNTKWPIQVHEYILNFVPGIDLFSKENDNEQGKGDQDMGDIWSIEE